MNLQESIVKDVSYHIGICTIKTRLQFTMNDVTKLWLVI